MSGYAGVVGIIPANFSHSNPATCGGNSGGEKLPIIRKGRTRPAGDTVSGRQAEILGVG